MKNALVCLAFISVTATAATPMARVIGVRDSHSIVVETNGVTSTVELKSVSVAPEEEIDATAYLRQLIANRWVYVDNGEVYRSPDALYVNGDMNHHPWHTMRILGELDLGARAKGQAAGNKVAAPPVLPAPAQHATPSRRDTPASRTRSPRSARAQ